MGMETFWLKDSRKLVDVAVGRKPADIVITDGKWICVQSGEIIEHTDIAISGHRIAYVGEDARHAIGPGTVVLEADGRCMVPGLLDGHMHVESGMLTVTEFVEGSGPSWNDRHVRGPARDRERPGSPRRAADGG